MSIKLDSKHKRWCSPTLAVVIALSGSAYFADVRIATTGEISVSCAAIDPNSGGSPSTGNDLAVQVTHGDQIQIQTSGKSVVGDSASALRFGEIGSARDLRRYFELNSFSGNRVYTVEYDSGISISIYGFTAGEDFEDDTYQRQDVTITCTVGGGLQHS